MITPNYFLSYGFWLGSLGTGDIHAWSSMAIGKVASIFYNFTNIDGKWKSLEFYNGRKCIDLHLHRHIPGQTFIHHKYSIHQGQKMMVDDATPKTWCTVSSRFLLNPIFPILHKRKLCHLLSHRGSSPARIELPMGCIGPVRQTPCYTTFVLNEVV